MDEEEEEDDKIYIYAAFAAGLMIVAGIAAMVVAIILDGDSHF